MALPTRAAGNDDIMKETHNVTIPAPIKPGSRIALVTPASWADSMVIVKAMDRLRDRGYEPVPMKHVFRSGDGGYTATAAERAVDLMTAFADPDIDAILCTRGGYGCVQLLPYINGSVIADNPKWLIGFSDISVLHALLSSLDIVSIHGPMCAHIGKEAADDACTQYLFDILEQGLPMTYQVPAHMYNHPGAATGRLVGGNFIVVNNMAQTDCDVIALAEDQDVILFFEEVGEKIYAVERMLMRLQQSGALDNVRGIVFGQFTDYKADQDYDSMEDMLYDWLLRWGFYERDIPIAFDFPAGHVKLNYPLALGAPATLSVGYDGVTLKMGE